MSGRCNLACSYCYQDRRSGPGRMPWPIARAALNFILERGRLPLTIAFSGGEPLLAEKLLVRCIEFVERNAPGNEAVHFVLTTNGTLLTPELLAFLATRNLSLQLSFDGVANAQGLRGAGTFTTLDGLLDRIRRDHPLFFRERLRVHATLQPSTISLFASSAGYFLRKKVPEVRFFPATGLAGAGGPEEYALLRREAERVAEASLRHYERTGQVPVLFLRRPEWPRAPERADGLICGAGWGKGLCVDAGGLAWSCPLFAGSLQSLSPLAGEASKILRLGDVRSAALAEQLASLDRRSISLRLLRGRREKYSFLGPCRECEFLDECTLCPAAVSHSPGNEDPDRVPDFVCAFARATGEARRVFQSRIGDAKNRPDTSEVLASLRRRFSNFLPP
ncbi:MAG: radical SAM protein [Acidobacteriota bacterium]